MCVSARAFAYVWMRAHILALERARASVYVCVSLSAYMFESVRAHLCM